MFRYLLVLAVCASIATSCGANNVSQFDTPARSSSSVNATSAWNSVCGQYNFIPKPMNPNATFSIGYHGFDFASDMAGITAAVNGIMSVQQPTTGSDVMSIQQPTTGSDVMSVQQPTTGSDVMKSTIENWGR